MFTSNSTQEGATATYQHTKNMTNYYRFIAYGGVKYDTDKVVGLMMSTRFKGAENLVRGGKLMQKLPEGVLERRWFGIDGQSVSGVLLDELKNGNVELYYPNDFGGYADALSIFMLLMTYSQLGLRVEIIEPDGTVVDNLLTGDAAEAERRMADWNKEKMKEKWRISKENGTATAEGFHCKFEICYDLYKEKFANMNEDEIAAALFEEMVKKQWEQ